MEGEAQATKQGAESQVGDLCEEGGRKGAERQEGRTASGATGPRDVGGGRGQGESHLRTKMLEFVIALV